MSNSKLKRRLADVEAKIERLQGHERPDLASQHFVGGRVGGAGPIKRIARLNRQRERELDRTIDRSVQIIDLVKERASLKSQLRHEVDRTARQSALLRYEQRTEQSVRSAGVGVMVDTYLGPVKVVRINRNSSTIETASGYREAIPWERIGRVHNERR